MDMPVDPVILAAHQRNPVQCGKFPIAPCPNQAEAHVTLHWGGPSAVSRDAAIDLTGLAGELAPGDSLRVSFLFDGTSPAGSAGGVVSVSIAARGLVATSANAAALCPAEPAVHAALRAAFPGCVVSPFPFDHVSVAGMADGLQKSDAETADRARHR